MRKHESTRRNEGKKVPPSRDHWWWRENRLKRALNGNPSLDHFFYWKVKGRKSPQGKHWTPAQRRGIETALWLYELDARISRKYLFGQPAHLLPPKPLSAVVEIAGWTNEPSLALKTRQRRRPFAWAWIESLDKRNNKKAPNLTRAELNGIIAAMKYCLEYFLHE
jgi:hypothetical protein